MYYKYNKVEPGEPAPFFHRTGQLLAGVLIGLLLAGVIFLLSSEPRGKPVELMPPDPLRVHVAGAVEVPGVYELPQGSIVQDAIAAAGGLRADADLSTLNLAQPVQDGQRIEVAGLVEPESQSASAQAGADGRVHLNSASAPELERLPGIGPALAQKIIQYREQHGPYQRLEDLLQVEGIGPAKLEGLREHIILP